MRPHFLRLRLADRRRPDCRRQCPAVKNSEKCFFFVKYNKLSDFLNIKNLLLFYYRCVLFGIKPPIEWGLVYHSLNGIWLTRTFLADLHLLKT